MRTIIAGSRTCHRYADLLDAIDCAALCGLVPSVILTGLAVGIDQLGIRWASEHLLPIEHYPAMWGTGEHIDRGAGFKRNERMAVQADALIAVWHKQSRGTADMIRRAQAHGLIVCVWEV